MRELYDRLIEEGEAGIDRLVAERMQESLQLDFKRKEVDRNGEFSTNDRKMLAEALSGFANSAGGLLIIGVDARKGTDGIDCAQDVRLIADIRRFLADANTEVGRLVQPRLDGVSVRAIMSDRVQGAGYLLVHVARSERRPHRSEAKGQKTYFKRVGDSFFEMEHYDIEDAFSRTTAPHLELAFDMVRPAEIGVNDKSATSLVLLSLLNTSNFTAKFPYMLLDLGPGLMPASEHRFFFHATVTYKIDGNKIAYRGGSDDVIHPSIKFPMAYLQASAAMVDHEWMVGGRQLLKSSLDMNCQFGCEGSRPYFERLSIPPVNAGLHP